MRTEEILGIDKIADAITNSTPVEIAAMWNNMIEEAGSYCITEDEVRSFNENHSDTLHALAAVMAAFAYEQGSDLGSAEIADARASENEDPCTVQAETEHGRISFVHLRTSDL